MERQTCFLLIATLTILLGHLSHGLPVKNVTTTKAPVQKSTSPAKPTLIGGHTAWETKIQAKHLKIFNDYKKMIAKKLQELHKTPATFVPKPEKFSRQVVGGINYNYLVKLPSSKYAFVSIHHRVWKKDHYGKKENIHIRTQAYSSAETIF